jgi:hypothetical protein
MNASHRSWADDSSEVTWPHAPDSTRPGDVLALSGEQIAEHDDEVFPLELFLEDGWDDDSTALSFFIDGRAPAVARTRSGCGFVTRASGVVKRVEEDRVLLGTPGCSSHEIALGYRVPASLDLRPLIGRRVLLTLEEESPSGGRVRQTLTVHTSDDRVWLVARSGHVDDVRHSLGGSELRLSLSPVPGGPLVVVAPGLQHIVACGGEARLRLGASRYGAELVAHESSGWAAYFLADDRLWH